MELVGRRSERAAVELAFQRAARGRRTVVTICGEAGIGKSALLAEVRSLARTAGAESVWTAVTDAESAIGWGGLATLLHRVNPALLEDRHPAHVAALRTVMGAGDTSMLDPLTAAAALAEVLRDLSTSGPAVVGIDDLHWLDAASAGAFSFAIRLLSGCPLLFVLTARPVRLPIELARLVDPEDLLVVEPAPLSVAGTRELLIERYGIQLGRVDLVHLHTATGGNPLHVIETGRLLQACVPLADALLPASLRDIIEVDLRRLDASHVPVLAAAALMPQPLLPQLRQLFDATAVDTAVSAAEAIDMVRVSDDVLEFRHPLIAAGLADGLTTAERRALHRRCADLASTDEVRALHISRAAAGVDPAAASLLDAAANAASETGLYANALAHAERALALTPPDDHVAVRQRQIRVATLAAASGEWQRVLPLVQPIVDQRDVTDPQWALVYTLAARATVDVYGSAAAVPMFESLVEMSPLGSVDRANAIDQLATVLLVVDVERSASVCADAEAAAMTAGDDRLAQVARSDRAVADLLAGRPVDHSTSEPGEFVTVSVLSNWLCVAVWEDDHERAEQLLDEGRRRLELMSTASDDHNLLNQAADLRVRQGRLDEAARLAEHALLLTQGKDHGSARDIDVAVLAAMRGDLDAARRHVAFAANTISTQPPMFLGQTHHGIGVVEAIAGNLREAVTQLRSAARAWDTCGVFDLGASPVRTELVEVLLLTGEIDEAEARVAQMVDLAETAGRTRCHAEVAYVRAQLLAAQGQLDDAASQADAAIAMYGSLELPILRARALLVAGSVARRRRQRALARQLLDEALAVFVACGAAGFVPRAHGELTRLGERAAPDQLTATETQVADLVAAGRTNDEVAASMFISRRTVESNLTRIYRKLDVRSRSELAARMSSR